MVLDPKDLLYFVQVVDRGGFSATGRSLRIPKSPLSHRIQQLEESLGVRLVSRTSRRFGMTEIWPGVLSACVSDAAAGRDSQKRQSASIGLWIAKLFDRS
jgi:hypothetical protein